MIIDSHAAYIPIDRRRAIARGKDLPSRMTGSVLMADISGFTPLTDTLVRELGPKQGANELTRQLNIVYGMLIAEVHRHDGSVVGFSGDAITCWFDDDLSAEQGPGSRRAVACALAMQRAIKQMAAVKTPSGKLLPLAIKVAVATGPVRRFRVGDPGVQYLDVLAGATLNRMATAEKQALQGEIVIEEQTVAGLGDQVTVAEWRENDNQRFAVVDGLVSSNVSTFSQDAPFTSIDEETPLDETQVRPWILAPIYKRLKAGHRRFLTEIRPSVALFLRFGGFDYDRDGTAGEKLDAYIRRVQNVLAHYEGYLIQLTIGEKGSYLYAAFGAPLAHDDDPSRAVSAALELRSNSSAPDFDREVQIGISGGRMRAGAYGSTARLTYGVIGDEVNVAARLMQQADPGQIIVSQRIASAVAKHFRLKAVGPLQIRGRQTDVPVSMVLGRQMPSLARLDTHFDNPLIGRRNELAQLRLLVARVLAGEGRILRLEGAAGVGKSHFIIEHARHALDQGLHITVGACQSSTRATPYYPWNQIFRTLFDLPERPLPGEDPNTLAARQISQIETVVDRSNPGWRVRLPLLGNLLNLPIAENETTAAFEAHFRQEALIALAVDIIQTWAKSHPLLLLLEDVHWLDEASQRLTVAIGRAIAKSPVLLVLVQRPTDYPLMPELDGLSHYQYIHLAELSRQETEELAAYQLEGEPSTLVLSLIQQLSQGNPFFFGELLNTLRESGRIQRTDNGEWILSDEIFTALREGNSLGRDPQRGEWVLTRDALSPAVDLGIPDSVQGLALSNLDRLTESAKLILKVASVIGYTFELDLLAGSYPIYPEQTMLLTQIGLLEKRGFIRRGLDADQLTFTFRHHIIQETVYDTLSGNQQRDLHLAVGESLERLQPEAVERLAYHYSRSGGRDKTLVYLDKAARKAQRGYANETALNYYNQALGLEERWEWRQNQVKVLHILGRREAERAGLKALETNPKATAFTTDFLWAQHYEATGNYPQARVAVESALSASRKSGDLESEARCLVQLGLIAYRQADYKTAQKWYRQALSLFQPDKTYSNELLQIFARAFGNLGVAHHQQGDFDEARICYEQALALSRSSGDRQAEADTLNGLGATAFNLRNFIDAHNYHKQALKIQRSIGNRAGEGVSLYNLAQVTRDTGDYSQAQNYLSEALIILQDTGNRWQEINVWNDLGILYQELGDLSKAQQSLESGLQIARDIDDEEGQAYLLSNLGLVVQDQGDLAKAERLLKLGLGLMQAMDNKRQVAFFFSYLAIVSLQTANYEQAIAYAGQALTLWQTLNLRIRATDDLATLAAAYLHTNNTPKALHYAEQALLILDEYGGEGPEFTPRDYFIGYQVLAADGQVEKALIALTAAYDLIMGRAEKITDPTLRRLFLKSVPINRRIVESYERVTNFPSGSSPILNC